MAAVVEARDARANNFDFIRLFAALATVGQHATGHTGIALFWFVPLTYAWFLDGVPLFFILSGMLVYQSFERCQAEGRPTSHYLTNRFLRIAPAIYMYAIGSVALLLAIGVIDVGRLLRPDVLVWLASTLLLVPIYHPAAFAGFGTGVLNGALWSIPAEFTFYLAVPLLFLLDRRLGRARMLLLTGLVGFTAYALATIFAVMPNEGGVLAKLFKVTMAPYLFYFAVGIFWIRQVDRIPLKGGPAALALGAYAGLTYLSHGVEGPLHAALHLAAILPLSYLAMWLGCRGPRVLRAFTQKIGDLSFGIYIWHMVVINALVHAVPAAQRGPWVHAVIFGVTFGLAYLSWWLVERPALRLKPFTSRKPAPAAARMEDAA